MRLRPEVIARLLNLHYRGYLTRAEIEKATGLTYAQAVAVAAQPYWRTAA